MGIETVFAIGSLALGAASYADAKSEQKQAVAARRTAAEEQKKIQSEQNANNAAQAAQERRAQVREERVRRARILQSAENSGVAGSSGEAGAVSSLATQRGANIGANLGRIASANRQSIFAQNASDNLFQASIFDQKAAQSSQLFGLAQNIFGLTVQAGAFRGSGGGNIPPDTTSPS